ncbi:hypothetical protein OAN96_00300 [Candidatus Gracilibacteria bacterium]|nr:hypothetical protein [Candidatus Gracilibacteria bacterium]
MENFNILSAGGFSFFLLVITMGYIIVEVICYKWYPFRKMLDTNNNHLFDRLIHYVFWGVLGNIAFFYLNYFAQNIDIFANAFNLSAPFAQQLETEGLLINGSSFQIIFFACFYFVSFLMVLASFGFMLWSLKFLFDQIESLGEYMAIEKEKREKKRKKKKSKKKKKKTN